MNNKISYTELSKANVSDSRNIVISTCSRGGFTIAQQLQAKEASKTTSVFLKGAFHVDDINGLYNLRDAVNVAINMVEDGKVRTQDEEWDAEWDA